MKTFRVRASQEQCADIYVEAETVEEAMAKVLHNNRWMTDAVQNPAAWCGGHEHTRNHRRDR